MNNKYRLILILIPITLLGQEIPGTGNIIITSYPKQEHSMRGMYGHYPFTREASGTSWTPDSTPENGFSKPYKDWMFMFMGYSYTVGDFQGGKRGEKKFIDENMSMIMSMHNFGNSTFATRSMFSLEPVTIGKCGYPLLLQTGETCNGTTPLIDRQHPHDLFMELALVYSYAFKDESSAFLYAALPGEPALGPPVFMMRYSAQYIPEAPLGHHWMDSTHIVFGVITGGLIHKGFKLEVSGFKGREPDQHRFDIEKPKIDSYSIRASLNPTADLAFQASYAFLKSPEQLEPEVNTKRFCASAIYNKRWKDNNLQASAIFGLNNNKPGRKLPAFLLEATLELRQRHMLFSRFEAIKNDELFLEPCPLADTAFHVQKFTLGYIFEIATRDHVKFGFGGLIDFPHVPKTIKPFYGNTISGMLFFQLRLI
jgi:hypothetical protein